jgi:hypothetical protein
MTEISSWFTWHWWGQINRQKDSRADGRTDEWTTLDFILHYLSLLMRQFLHAIGPLFPQAAGSQWPNELAAWRDSAAWCGCTCGRAGRGVGLPPVQAFFPGDATGVGCNSTAATT